MDSKDIPRGIGALEEKSRQYRADIAFRYQANDKAYMGDKVSVEFAPWWTRDYTKAKRILTRYPVGEDVIVYYDPKDPSKGGTRSWCLTGDFGWVYHKDAHRGRVLRRRLLCEKGGRSKHTR
jgi:Protein of unknown function (DUF3592)